uniref:Uncharacterized protein n=1 Tax=Rhizophora mucronata TaxID=61149 RepID=A0A2P2IIT4_RHIMU
MINTLWCLFNTLQSTVLESGYTYNLIQCCVDLV